MSKIVGRKTKSLIKDGLCHFTKSDYLDKIITKNGILMRASCIKSYWKTEVNPFDDNQEVKGLMELKKTIDPNIPTEKFKNELICGETVQQLVNGINHDSATYSDKKSKKLPVIISTNTPYILCFGYDSQDEHMFHKFCNPQRGYPIMLKFNSKKILNNPTKWMFESEANLKEIDDSTEKEEIMHIYYTQFDDFSYLKDVNKTLEEAKNELATASGDNSDQTLLDSIYYVKRGRYSDEKEVRYILRINEPSAFGLSPNNKFIYRTEKAYGNLSVDQAICCENCDRHYAGEDIDSYILVRFLPECLDKIIIGPCAPESLVTEIKDKLDSTGGLYKHVTVERFNKTK